jgi:hypothetical protein
MDALPGAAPLPAFDHLADSAMLHPPFPYSAVSGLPSHGQDPSAAAAGCFQGPGGARQAPAKVEHYASRATRRGPMDEMRQLIRILAKLMPNSERNLRIAHDDSGGNRVSEEQIRRYLEASLGEAPKPEWGLPVGWGQYLAGVQLVLRP